MGGGDVALGKDVAVIVGVFVGAAVLVGVFVGTGVSVDVGGGTGESVGLGGRVFRGVGVAVGQGRKVAVGSGVLVFVGSAVKVAEAVGGEVGVAACVELASAVGDSAINVCVVVPVTVGVGVLNTGLSYSFGPVRLIPPGMITNLSNGLEVLATEAGGGVIPNANATSAVCVS